MNLKKSASVISIISLLFFSTKVMSAEECFENISRSIFKFNMGVDNAIIEPLAKGYNKLPDPIKKGTSNFTSNISTLLSIPNSLLQGNLKQVGHASGSFIINSSVRILDF